MIENKVMVAPSILAADFGHLAQEMAAIEKDADFLHFDVMDGHFVPNISFGIPVLSSIRPYSKLPFDVHLMIDNPREFVGPFIEAGADYLTFHIETEGDPEDLARIIREKGARPGVSIHPDTPTQALAKVIGAVDLVLVMSVRPGFGGQGFMPEAFLRIAAIRRMLNDCGSEAILSVDGGISKSNAAEVVQAGATMLVAGSSVFGAADKSEAVRGLKACAMS